ncbi:sulfite exporter TauE/SafE family protein [Stieleria sp. JC731]|uniref:sulfite exporter TauE/SafE family protein n=1 Tax=Pirellulaceae TaxID=2691357 RepID=UPI001E58A56F|nr:sulfite exporter TauE/SafE family protein [Stieleria sp. JC731]MCC9603625.1 sulfite exporter TauE/SafE family protein [Stieleria sp. JC731]
MSDPATLVAILAFALIAGFVHSAVGFGFGIVAVTLLPWAIDVKQAQIVISTASVPVMLAAVWNYRNGAEFRHLLRALIGAAIALPIGLYAFEVVTADWLVRGTGVAILLMVGLNLRNRAKARTGIKSGDGSALIAGGIGGFLAGAVSIAGPPVAAFALSQPWDQRQFKAFMNQFLFVVSVYKFGGLLVRQLVDMNALTQAAVVAPAAMIGIQLGVIASKRLTTSTFQHFVAVALTLVAFYYVIAGG